MRKLLRRILKRGKHKVPTFDEGCDQQNNRKRNIERLKVAGIFILFVVGIAAIDSLFRVWAGEDYTWGDGSWVELVEMSMAVGWTALCLWIVTKTTD